MIIIRNSRQKVVDKVVQKPVIHMFCGEINPSNPELKNHNLFYFLRTSEEGIPSFDSWESCNGRMTDYLIVGSINGSILSSLKNMLINVSLLYKKKQ